MAGLAPDAVITPAQLAVVVVPTRTRNGWACIFSASLS
jgi:hypothetical protein